MRRTWILLLLVGLALSPVLSAARSLPLPALVKQHAAKVTRAARKAGGQLELYRDRTFRLLVNDKGKLLYQRVNTGSTAAPRSVRWWGAFRTFKLATPSDGQLEQRFKQLVLRPRSSQRDQRSQHQAILPDGREVTPDINIVVYHGTTGISPQVALTSGLPARGSDWRLQQHVEPTAAPGKQHSSAFRGATQVVADPIAQNGAAYWADKGGWVYQIEGLGGWDVNAQLYGRIAKPVGFRGNLMSAEQEIAIPARVPAMFIKAYGQVQQDGQGRLFVRDWVQNPGFVGQASDST